jgi:hypothetical protein
MYQASVPVLSHVLKNLSSILEKAEAHAEAKKIDQAVFISARLAPDMLALARQVQIATDTAKGCAARLAGSDIPSYEDNETTFAALRERIGKTVAFLESVPAARIDGSEDRSITLKLGGNETHFSGQSYLLNFVLPNLYFHVTTAYAILRHNGVDIGKRDYLGSF